MSLTKKLTGKTNAATSRKLTQPPTGVSGGTSEAAPTVITNPQSQTKAEGTTATFTVSASGSNPKTYQWEISTNNGVDWSEITDETSASYTTGTLTEAGDSGDQFRCVVTNDFGSDTSDAATLTVIAAPVITDQPDNTSVSVGAEASFTVAATGSGTLTYQWERSTDSGSNWSNISGATSTTYTIAETIEDEDGYQYRCKVTNEGGTTTSDTATLTVSATSYLLDDYTGASFAYSLRQLRTGVTNVIRVRRSSDSTEQDFTAEQVIDGTLEAFCGVGNGCVTTFYDQSGNGNHATQSTTAFQADIVTSGVLNTVNGKPAVIGDGASYYTATLASSFNTAELFVLKVAATDSNGGSANSIGGLCTAGNALAYNCLEPFHMRTSTSSWPRLFYGNGTTFADYAASPYVFSDALQLHICERRSAQVFRGYRNGTTVISQDAATNYTANASRVSLFSRNFGAISAPYVGDFCEFIVWPSNLQASKDAIQTEVATHYGITIA